MGTTNKAWKPRKRPIQRRSRETVGYILEAAAQLFGELGYERTTTNHIAERAGVAIGSVYQYFPNKESLLLALLERHLAEVCEKATSVLRELRERGVPPEEFFRGFVELVVDFHQGGGPLRKLLYEEAPRSKQLVELGAAIDAGRAAEIEAYLRGRGLDGQDLSIKSTVLANMMGELTHNLVLDPPTAHTPAAYREEIVAACLAYLYSSSGATG